MKIRSLHAVSILVSALMLAPVPAAASGDSAETVTFRFAPPDGTEVLRTEKTLRKLQLGEYPPRHDRIETGMEIDFRKTEEGYAMRSKVVEASLERSLVPLRYQSIVEMLDGFELTHLIGEDGELESLGGYTEFFERLRIELGMPRAANFSGAWTSEGFVATAEAEWQDRITALVGSTFELGASFDTHAIFALPNDLEVAIRGRTTLSGFEDCAAGSCVRLETRYESDPEVPEETESADVSRLIEEIARECGSPFLFESEKKDAERVVSGRSSRLLDPNTMLIYEEEQFWKFRLLGHAAEVGSMPCSFEEGRTYTFDYGGRASVRQP